MNTTASPQSSLPELTDRLFAHLADEESSLTAMRESLIDVRAALVNNDPEALANSLAKQADVADSLEIIVRRRAEVLNTWSQVSGLPLEELTLQKLTGTLTEESATRLLESRGRLRELAKEVQRLNRGNAMLVNHSIELTRRVMDELTPGGIGGEGYNAQGSRQEPARGPMIKMGG